LRARFQSPLRRGCFFNIRLAGCPGIPLGVSVPSSSGMLLQRRISLAWVRPSTVSVPSSSGMLLQQVVCQVNQLIIQGFSPLFVGDASSTRSIDPGDRRLDAFQSPLRRGCFFNRKRASYQEKGIEFQSPLRRGCFFNSVPPMVLRPGADVSVPSSSGMLLQPLHSTPVFRGIQATAVRKLRKPQTCTKPRQVCEIRPWDGCDPSALSFRGSVIFVLLPNP